METDRIESKDLSTLNPMKFQLILKGFAEYDQVNNDGLVALKAVQSKKKNVK